MAAARPAAEQAPAASEAIDFGALYRRLVPDVYAYVATLLQDRHAAEDVVATAFERAWRKRARFRRGRGTPEAWVFGIARNAALDELRRRKRGAALPGDLPDLAGAGPAERLEQAVESGLRRARVRSALAGLTPRERELVGLKFGAGLTNSDIAAVLGVSESNAGTLLHRTVEKLRRTCREEA